MQLDIISKKKEEHKIYSPYSEKRSILKNLRRKVYLAGLRVHMTLQCIEDALIIPEYKAGGFTISVTQSSLKFLPFSLNVFLITIVRD